MALDTPLAHAASIASPEVQRQAYVYTLEDKKKDAAEAFNRARRYHAELREIHRWYMPFRGVTTERASASGEASEGQSHTNHLFDGTGPSSAFAFVSNMKADWMPAFQDFFQLKNGPLYLANAEAAAARAEQLQNLTRVIHGLTSRPRGTTTEEMFQDLFAGTGAMCLVAGDRNNPIRGFSVPTLEIALDTGPYGDLERWFWKRNYKARHIPQMWPKAAIPLGLANLLRMNRNADVEVTQYTYWDPNEKMFRLSVWTNIDNDAELWTEATRTSPWITPRLFVVPGESMGRGFAHLGLPFVKTVNKARELSLRAAAFALLGLWTRRQDGVFNEKTAAMVPGAMWKVGSNGGPQGPTIQRLDVPHNFDISTVVIKDERDQIRRVLLDDELPDINDKVRSPTEISGRMRRYERTRGGATTRLAFELVQPFVQRSVDILGELRLLPKDLVVDDILTQAVVSAPAATAQRTDKVDRMVSWLQMMTGLVGPQMTALNAKLEEILPEIGRDLGIDEKFIRRKTEMEQLKGLIDNAVQTALKAQKGVIEPPQPAAPPPDPAAQFTQGAF